MRSRPTVAWDEMESLITTLRLKHNNASHPRFAAQVTGRAKNAAYGFSAKLSEEALQEVMSHFNLFIF